MINVVANGLAALQVQYPRGGLLLSVEGLCHRTSSLERPLAARAVQRRPSNLSRGTGGTTLAAADLGSASGCPSPPSEAGSSRKLLEPPAQSGSPSKRQQRLDWVHSKARLRKV